MEGVTLAIELEEVEMKEGSIGMKCVLLLTAVGITLFILL